METIDKLLDLYFAGETTTAQEQELKNYFASSNIADEHKIYQQLFETFITEKQEKYPENLPKIKQQPYFKQRFFISLVSAAAVAASVLLAFGIFSKMYNKDFEDYIIINGKRINDKQLAMHTAKEKLICISEKLETGLKPVEKISEIGEKLQPLQKMQTIRTNMQNTFEKITIK
jgi:hypothetical protein